jgi:hypothetical protein
MMWCAEEAEETERETRLGKRDCYPYTGRPWGMAPVSVCPGWGA